MPVKLILKSEYQQAVKGGTGSGNFGHSGRSGKVGGSAPKPGGSTKIGALKPSKAGEINASMIPNTITKIISNPKLKKFARVYTRSGAAGAIGGAAAGMALGTMFGALGAKLKIGNIAATSPHGIAAYILGGVAGTALTSLAGGVVGGAVGAHAGQLEAIQALVGGDAALSKADEKLSNKYLRGELKVLGDVTKANANIMLRFAVPSILSRVAWKGAYEFIKKTQTDPKWQDAWTHARTDTHTKRKEGESDYNYEARKARARAQYKYEQKQKRNQADYETRKGKRNTERQTGVGGKLRMNADDIARAQRIANLKNRTSNAGEREAARARLRDIMDKYDVSHVPKSVLEGWKAASQPVLDEIDVEFAVKTSLNVLLYVLEMINVVALQAKAHGVLDTDISTFRMEATYAVQRQIDAMMSAFSAQNVV
jgi:hypothetical protein